MASQNSDLRVGTDAEGGGCWEVTIDGILHQNRSQAQLRALIEQRRARLLHKLSARWAQLEPIEGLSEDAELTGRAGMVQDGHGWRVD